VGGVHRSDDDHGSHLAVVLWALLGLGLIAKAGEGDCSDPTSLCATDGPVRGSDIAVMAALGAASGLGWAWWARQPRHLLYMSSDTMDEMGLPPAAPGLTPADVRPDWLALARFEGGTVEVAASSSQATLEGTLLKVTPQVIQLLVDGEPYVLRHADVRKLWSEPRVEWWRAGVASLYYGAVWGALISIATCGTETETGEWSACDGRTMGITTGVLAAVFVCGVARQRHDALAYDSSRPAPPPKSTLMLGPLVSPRGVGIQGAIAF
jgi:hypothetical protein